MEQYTIKVLWDHISPPSLLRLWGHFPATGTNPLEQGWKACHGFSQGHTNTRPSVLVSGQSDRIHPNLGRRLLVSSCLRWILGRSSLICNLRWPAAEGAVDKDTSPWCNSRVVPLRFGPPPSLECGTEDTGRFWQPQPLGCLLFSADVSSHACGPFVRAQWPVLPIIFTFEFSFWKGTRTSEPSFPVIVLTGKPTAVRNRPPRSISRNTSTLASRWGNARSHSSKPTAKSKVVSTTAQF